MTQVDPPDYQEWVRTADLDRIARVRDGRKALAQIRLKAKSADSNSRAAGGKPGRKGGRSGPEAAPRSKKSKSSKRLKYLGPEVRSAWTRRKA